MSTKMKPKHGRELREFWRIQKAKYRARKKAKDATIEGETSKAQSPTNLKEGEP